MKDRLLDIVTGIVVGGMVGIFYPLTEYTSLLVLLTVVFTVRLLALK